MSARAGLGGIVVDAMVTVAVLLSIFVAWVVARIVLLSIRDARRRGLSQRTVQHLEFGELSHELGIWSGRASHDDRPIKIHIGGTSQAPDPYQLERLRFVLQQIGELEGRAQAFIRAEASMNVDGVSSANSAKQNPNLRFMLESLDIADDARSGAFALEFSRQGDVDGVWRVQFENGEPVSVRMDD